MKFLTRIKRFFTGSVSATGTERMYALNRKERRARAAIARRAKKRDSVPRPKG